MMLTHPILIFVSKAFIGEKTPPQTKKCLLFPHRTCHIHEEDGLANQRSRGG